MNSKLVTFLLVFLLFLSTNIFSQEQEEIQYDFSDFEPLSPEKFVEENFLYLKEYYERDPKIIEEGLEVVYRPPAREGYRATVAVNQVYSELVRSAFFEWVKSSGYVIGYTVYGQGYNVYPQWGGKNMTTLSFTPRFSFTRGDKTMEEYFRYQNKEAYGRRLSGGTVSNKQYSRINGVLSVETESLYLTASRDSAMRAQKIKWPERDDPKSKWVDFYASNSNSYVGYIGLMNSKYGSWGASTSKYSRTGTVIGGLDAARGMLASALAYCNTKINAAKSLFYQKMGVEVEEEKTEDDPGNEIVVEVSKKGYVPETRALAKRDKEASEVTLSGMILDKEGNPVDSAKVILRGLGATVFSSPDGSYSINTKTSGEGSHSETMDIKLQEIKIEISNEELGKYKEGENFGIVSDGFTPLKLKVKTYGISPRTVSVKKPALGDFVEQSMLKVPLVLDGNGEGEMEYIPPTYLKNSDLTKHPEIKHNPNNQYGLSSRLWLAEVPITFTYEDEEGNPGSYTIKIQVTRPPVMLIHGFTGDETTWATLANFLRTKKYEPVVREYYQGPADESNIQRQSEKLGFYIQKLRDAYKENGFLQTRVDIVAHSMGGLISRYYINNMSKYGEKAGIYIPYDVKLSRKELEEGRNLKPVKLIDVRKLIMVGTPNHGATRIDELFGVMGALSSDYHQLANGQLRSDSPFFEELNSGENEGRHLDPNVQYAILYGIRKRSEFYPPDRLLYPWQTSQKNFADDDGVVKVSSARLNGILNIPFPKDWFAIHGYIHSPAVEPFFMGDASITEAETIFEEVDILLLQDIERTPLENSSAKILHAKGAASMRYFSTENWKFIHSGEKLENNWCQIKTEEGTANLGFFLNGNHWGTLHAEPNTIVFYEYASPQLVKVYLQKGKALFRSKKQMGGGFEVVLGEQGEKWYEFNPKAKVRDLDTDFIVAADNEFGIYSVNGKVVAGIIQGEGKELAIKELETKAGLIIDQQGKTTDTVLPEDGWWNNVNIPFEEKKSPAQQTIPETKAVITQTSTAKTDARDCLAQSHIVEAHQLMQSAFQDYQEKKEKYEQLLEECKNKKETTPEETKTVEPPIKTKQPTSSPAVLPKFESNLIKNGGFEEPQIANYQSFMVGQEIAGWKVVMAPVDLTGTYFESSEGKQSLDLHGTPGFGSVEQTFRTEPQMKYRVTFDMAGNPGEPILKKLRVSAAGESKDFEFNCTGKSTQQMGWTKKTFEFTAYNITTTLSFATLNTTGNGNYGPAIDNVRVVAVNKTQKETEGTDFGILPENAEMTFKSKHDWKTENKGMAYAWLYVTGENGDTRYFNAVFNSAENPGEGVHVPNNHFGIYNTTASHPVPTDCLDAGENYSLKTVSGPNSDLLFDCRAFKHFLDYTIYWRVKFTDIPKGNYKVYYGHVMVDGSRFESKLLGTFVNN